MTWIKQLLQLTESGYSIQETNSVSEPRDKVPACDEEHTCSYNHIDVRHTKVLDRHGIECSESRHDSTHVDDIRTAKKTTLPLEILPYQEALCIQITCGTRSA
jgi:hypothetical protein